MYNNNKYKCVIKGNPLEAITCLSCSHYTRCPELALNLFRQRGDGNIGLHYDVEKIIRKVAHFLGVSTKEVILVLKKKHGLSIGRTTILKYHKMGLLDLDQKIGKGRAKGVESFWKNNTTQKILIINLLKSKGIKLKEFKKYQDIVNIKEPNKLAAYAPGVGGVMFEEDLAIRIDMMKFYTVVGYLAALELKIPKPSNYDPTVNYNKDNPGESTIEVIFTKETPKKRIVFTKNGAKVLDVA